MRYEVADMADVPVDAEGHFVATVADGRLAARRTPEPVAPLLDRAAVDADGMALGVALNTAEGVLCATSESGEEACAGGARRYRCPEGADCLGGDGILVAAADVVVTDWSIENPTFESLPWRVRIWRITTDGPQPLIELDLPARPAEAWASSGGNVVELVVAGNGGGPWRIVRCVIGKACTRSGPFGSRPTIRSAMTATLADPNGAHDPWPDDIDVELDACQVLWPPAVEVRGRLISTSSPAVAAPTGSVQLTIARPEGEPPTLIPLAVSIDAAGAFSFVVENPPLGFITEPVALQRLLAEGSCQLQRVQPDGLTAPLTPAVPLS
ncbi:MAG: hypothetical protein AB7W59_12990 [Acidimicrobiia bacterium]